MDSALVTDDELLPVRQPRHMSYSGHRSLPACRRADLLYSLSQLLREVLSELLKLRLGTHHVKKQSYFD